MLRISTGQDLGNIKGWKIKLLSKAAKEILIKAVLQAVPTYAMACFDLTKSLCDSISQMVCKFWWANQDEDDRHHWVSWEKMTLPKEQGGLGFRDLHSFNMAMLSRQIWRLIQAPESLCARVLQAKYFPEGDILKATSQPGMSYVWRSLLQGVDIIKAGMIWRVGSGEHINIWADPWLPSNDLRRPRTLQGVNILTRVLELLDPATNTWDAQLVRQTFCPEDAATILSIPIYEHYDDFVAWYFDPKGLFSVRSAYRLYVELQERQGAHPRGQNLAGTEEAAAFWKKLWSIRCPGRVHHFMWRLAHNSHPLLRNVERIGVELDTKCVICHRVPEDGAHLFLRCKEVKKVWREGGLEQVRQLLLTCQTPKEMLRTIFNLSEEKKLRSICTLWSWWSERNKANHKQPRRSGEALQAHIGYAMSEWMQFLSKRMSEQTKPNPKWTAPPSDLIKINFDAAFNPATGEGGWGAIAAAGKLDYLGSALQAESEALIQTIKLAEGHGMGRVVFETDCLILQQAVSSFGQDRGPLGILFREARFLLQLGFIQYQVVHCPRVCNKPAHVLAAYGSSSDPNSLRLRLSDVPDNVIRAVTADMVGPP